MKNKTIQELFIVALISFLPIFAVYIPFLLKLHQFVFLTIPEPGFANILKNWDGPHYVIVAKSFYDLSVIKKLLFIQIDPLYYTAHFPLFPLLMDLLKPFINLFKGGLIINLIFGFVINWLFFKFSRNYTKHPYFLTFLFTVFPPRFWVVRSIIAPENLMLFCMMLSYYFWVKKKYFLSSIFGALAVVTKIQAIFLFFAYFVDAVLKIRQRGMGKNISTFWALLIPLSFVGLSVFYYFRVGDFMAFFHAEKGNNLYVYFPFSQFNYSNHWAGTGWLEDVVFYFVAMFTLVAALWKSKEKLWLYFALSYTVFLVFIPQRDITRFSFPLLPVFLLTFESFFTSKVFKWGLILSLPALYFYVINFMLVNQAPIANWTPLLK